MTTQPPISPDGNLFSVLPDGSRTLLESFRILLPEAEVQPEVQGLLELLVCLDVWLHRLIEHSPYSVQGEMQHGSFARG